jgi:hypothetical protein
MSIHHGACDHAAPRRKVHQPEWESATDCHDTNVHKPLVCGVAMEDEQLGEDGSYASIGTNTTGHHPKRSARDEWHDAERCLVSGLHEDGEDDHNAHRSGPASDGVAQHNAHRAAVGLEEPEDPEPPLHAEEAP